MRMSSAARRMLSSFFSNSNSGVWTPMTTKPTSLYFSAHPRTYGSVRNQLMHVYVQNWTSTTLPLRPPGANGGELSHPVAPSKDGNMLSTGSSSSPDPTPWCRAAHRRPFPPRMRRLDQESSYLWLPTGLGGSVHVVVELGLFTALPPSCAGHGR